MVSWTTGSGTFNCSKCCTQDVLSVHAELPDHSEAYGSVSSVRLAYDSAGRCQGFG